MFMRKPICARHINLRTLSLFRKGHNALICCKVTNNNVKKQQNPSIFILI